MRKMTPLKVRRQWAGGRPVALRGQNSLRIGSIRCHNSSGISQIVPNGLRRVFLRPMAAAPVAMGRCGLTHHKPFLATGVPTVPG
jgi:hypothetical protein